MLIARNNANANIRKAKTNIYKRFFETNLGDINKSWKGVNSILGRNLPTTEINRIDVGDNSSTTPLEISNALNYHFTHIGPRLADNIPKTSVCFEDYIHRIHKWRTRGKKLVPSHESEALEDKQKLQIKTFSELAECLARIGHLH